MSLPSPLDPPDELPLGVRLRSFRDAHAWSRADLAAKLGVTATTLCRWETGSTRPSPTAAEKLQEFGFVARGLADTNAATVPRLKHRSPKTQATADAAALRKTGAIVIGSDETITVLPSPFVRNGPPDQAAFHHRLLALQTTSSLPAPLLARRFSMVENVHGEEPTCQHRLEKPRPIAVSWNSNYGSHGWHRYVGRFPSHVVRALLNHFGANANSVVCDPFSGSGTTAVECRLLGVPFVGIEVCPLSAMMTRTKAAFPIDPAPLLALTTRFETFYEQTWQAFVRGRYASRIPHAEILARPGCPIPAFANVERWFTGEALLGTSIAVEFGLHHDGFAREAVLLALSARMRSIGNVDVDVVRAEYSRTPRSGVDVGRLVSKQLAKMARDIAASVTSHSGLLGKPSDIVVHQGSVLEVDLEDSSIGHVITSPPYGIEAISYLRTHLLSYRSLVAHLGHDPYDTRGKTIGSEYLTSTEATAGIRASERSKACRVFFARPTRNDEAKDGPRRAAMLQFCDDMLLVGERMARWLRPGGRVAFVMGNKRLGDDVIPMDRIVTELFASCGLQPVDAIRHKLKTNNSNSQVPWQAKIIQEESILLFHKAGT